MDTWREREREKIHIAPRKGVMGIWEHVAAGSGKGMGRQYTLGRCRSAARCASLLAGSASESAAPGSADGTAAGRRTGAGTTAC